MTDRNDPATESAEAGTGTQGDERRQSERCDAHVAIHVAVSTTAFSGRTQNVSRAGVFFFSEDQLRVTVELEQDGERVRRTGQLVRVERMNEDTTGFAIAFDE